MATTVRPRVIIDFKVRQKIMYWVKNTDYEVSGLGKVIVQNGVIKVIDAMLLDQKNTTGNTEIDAAAIGKAMFELKDQPGELRFWWHSHAKMGVFWSGTDEAAMKQLGDQGWFLNTVFNHKGESRTAIYMGKPFPVFMDEMTLEDEFFLDQDDVAEWKAEYDKKVVNNGWKPWTPGSGAAGLSKKARKRLAKEEKANLRLAATSSNTAGATATGTTSGTAGTGSQGSRDLVSENALDDGFYKNEYGVWVSHKQKQPPECILCGFRYSCKCPRDLLDTAHALDELGICWACGEDFEQCECDNEDLLVAAHGLTRVWFKDRVNLLDALLPGQETAKAPMPATPPALPSPPEFKPAETAAHSG